MVAKQTDTSPPTSAIMDGPPPLYGTCTIFTPVRLLKYSPARCAADPLPEEEYASWPGRALANAMYSLTVFTGTDGCTTRMCGVVASCVIAAKSFTRSKLSFDVELCADRVGDADDEQRVAVGRRFRRDLRPDVGAAAGPVFHHHLLPEQLESSCATMRPRVSVPPPGGKRDDETHRLVRVLRSCRQRPGQKRQKDDQAESRNGSHGEGGFATAGRARGSRWRETRAAAGWCGGSALPCPRG